MYIISKFGNIQKSLDGNYINATTQTELIIIKASLISLLLIMRPKSVDRSCANRKHIVVIIGHDLAQLFT